MSISNQNVLAAEAQFRAARAAVRVARADQFPTVTAAPSATRSGAGAASGVQRLYTIPIDVTYQADVWGSIRRSVAANAAFAQASAADLENARLLYQAELAADYFQIQGLDAERQLLDATVKSYEQYVQLTQDRYEGGVASMGDVALAQTQLETARAQLADLGIQRAQFEHAIAVLTGKPPSELSIPVAPTQSRRRRSSIGLPSTLLERRPDIAAAERQVAAANEQIGVAKAAFYPSLSFGASAGSQAAAIVDLLTSPTRFWSVGAQLAETLFDGGKRRAQVRLTEAAYDATVANYRQTVLTGFQQVEDRSGGVAHPLRRGGDRRPGGRSRPAVAGDLDDPVSWGTRELSAGHHRADQLAAESTGGRRYSHATPGRERVLDPGPRRRMGRVAAAVPGGTAMSGQGSTAVLETTTNIEHSNPQSSPRSSGLTSVEATRRLAEYGPNEPMPKRRLSAAVEFGRLFANPLVLILLVASAVSAWLGEDVDAGIIAAIVLLSVIVDFWQSYRSQRAADRLRASVAPAATVLRDGTWKDIPLRQLVPGDVVRLSAGDLVPADARLLDSRDLSVQQSMLTGESLPVDKKASADQLPPTMGPDAEDLVFLGTSVVSGTAAAIVTATGPKHLSAV